MTAVVPSGPAGIEERRIALLNVAVSCFVHAGAMQSAADLVERETKRLRTLAPSAAVRWVEVLAAADRHAAAVQLACRAVNDGASASAEASDESRRELRHLVGECSLRLAMEALQREDLIAAAEAAEVGRQFAPHHFALRDLCTELGNASTLLHLKLGDRSKARAAWRARVRAEPEDWTTWHHLALGGWFEALATDSREAWSDAIAGWGAILANSDYWADFVVGRLDVLGPMAEGFDETGEDLRTGLTKHVHDTLDSRCSDRELAQAPDAIAFRRGLLIDLTTELNAATQHRRDFDMADGEYRRGSATAPVPALGPLALERAGLLGKALAAADNKPLSDYLWSDYILPMGRVDAALKENLATEAWAETVRVGQQRRLHGYQAAIGARAAHAHAMELADESAAMALGILSVAKQMGLGAADPAFINDAESLSATTKEVAARRFKQAATEHRKTMRDASSNKLAAELAGLKIVASCVEDLRTAAHLEESCRGLLSTALVMKANHLWAMANREERDATGRGGRAAKAPLPARFGEAISTAREALRMAPQNVEAAEALSKLLSNHGVHECNCDRESEGVAQLYEALGIDPENEHARRELPGVLLGQSTRLWNEMRGSSDVGRAVSLAIDALKVSRGDPTVRRRVEQLRDVLKRNPAGAGHVFQLDLALLQTRS